MKINSKQKNINNVFHHISILMANDLGMPYLSNKIEMWLSENFFYIYKKYKE